MTSANFVTVLTHPFDPNTYWTGRIDHRFSEKSLVYARYTWQRQYTELEAYGHGLLDKPEIVALTKADALAPDAIEQQVARLKRAMRGTGAGTQATPLVISAVSGAGVEDVLRALLREIETARAAAPDRAAHAPAWQP